MKIFTKEDIAIAKELPKQYKYMTRNKSGELNVHKKLPEREGGIWWSNSYMSSTDLNEGFDSISWEDEEPTLIEDIIKFSF